MSGLEKVPRVGPVHFGDKFRLFISGPDGTTLYLHSEVCTPTITSKYSRYQSVSGIASSHGAHLSSNALWEILPADNRDRVEKICTHEIVTFNEPVCLRHVGTGSLLASDTRFPQFNLYGNEFEVSCHNYQTINKSHNLDNERLGIIAPDSPTRLNLNQTIWYFSL